MEVVRFKRRRWLAACGLSTAGLCVGFALPDAMASPSEAEPLGLNAFVHVGSDGVVTIVCARSEMGQGVRSSLPALIADELGADLQRVRIVQADGDPVYGDQNTDGSSSVRKAFDHLRRIGAVARTMLIGAAARRWRVPASTCVAHDHAVHHPPSRRTLGFGELATDAAKLQPPKPERVQVRPRAELRYLGKALPFVDGPDIVTGRAVFGADVELPGMLTAVIARPPVAGGRVASHDATRTQAVAGVRRVVVLPTAKLPFGFAPLGGVAVVADHTWAAMRGREELDVTWEGGPHAAYDSRTFRQQLDQAVLRPGNAMRNVGDVESALAGAAKQIAAAYHTPHLAHATMEPLVAVARVEGRRCEVWAPTQDPQSAREEVAGALSLGKEDVTIHVTFLGGGFGRKSKPDFIVEAAWLAREVGAPVRVQWTREDDMRHDYYHATASQHLAAGLDDRGKVVAWRHRIAFPSISTTFRANADPGIGELQQGVLDMPLVIPNVRAEVTGAQGHTRIGWLRSVANIYHAFAIHSFIDELAHARGLDPRENLLELLGSPRLVQPSELGVERLPNYGQSLDDHPVDVRRFHRVIERVTALAKWEQRAKDGRSLGLAVHRSFLTYVAVVLGVARGHDGRVRVDQAFIVADAGTIINRERVLAQLEGAVVFGMSLALHGAITMKQGATEQSNFHDYRLVRMAAVPRAIHAEIIESDAPPGGVGEPGVPPVAPALTNALFALTGTRARELPLAQTFPV